MLSSFRLSPFTSSLFASSTPDSVLVYGASGVQGYAIASALLASGSRVRLLLRPASANPFDGAVDVVRGDLGDPDSLRRASLGVDKVVLTLPQGPAPALLAQYGRNAVAAARAAGAQLLVWNGGGPLPPGRTRVGALEARRAVEEDIRTSGLPAIMLRSTLAMENLAAPWSAPAIAREGIFAYPLPATLRAAWISWHDVAAVIVAASRRPDLAGQAFDLAGPELLSGADMAAILSASIGRRVAYVPVPLGDFAAGLNAAFGGTAGDDIAAFYAWFGAEGAALRSAGPSAAEAGLPAPATRFVDWVRAQPWSSFAAGREVA